MQRWETQIKGVWKQEQWCCCAALGIDSTYWLHFLNENIYFENINFFSNKFCYGLNVCASSKFIYWSSSPHCDCFGGWGLSEVFILNKVRRMEPNPWWDLCPSKKRKRSELSQYWMWAQREKVTIYKAGKLNHTDTWSWISQLLELWQINVCG